MQAKHATHGGQRAGAGRPRASVEMRKSTRGMITVRVNQELAARIMQRRWVSFAAIASVDDLVNFALLELGKDR